MNSPSYQFKHRLSYPKSFDSQCEQSDLIQAESFLMQDSSNKDKYNDRVCAMTLVWVKWSGEQVNLQGKTNNILLATTDIIFLTLSANIWRYDSVVVNVLDF